MLPTTQRNDRGDRREVHGMDVETEAGDEAEHERTLHAGTCRSEFPDGEPEQERHDRHAERITRVHPGRHHSEGARREPDKGRGEEARSPRTQASCSEPAEDRRDGPEPNRNQLEQHRW